MPDGFSTPVGIKNKEPKLVPLSQTDAERQRLYQPLAEMNESLKAEPKMPVMGVPEQPPEIPVSPEPEIEPPTEEDKQAFLASILGGKKYEKIYTIFGNTKVRMVDRGVEETELIFSQVNLADEAGLIKTEGDYLLTMERYQLAYQLYEVHSPASGSTGYEPLGLDKDKLQERVKALFKLSKPLYQALMEVCRIFEAHVDLLTQKATDANFWKPGVQSSPSTPRAQARSTTPNIGVTTGTGR